MTQTIDITDVGPAQRLAIPVQPGLVILRGRNDCGKSRSLDAVARLAGAKADLTKRDGSASGSIEGLGVRIVVGKSARRTGELEALSIEGRLSVADLVDPGIDNPEAADARRIKALLQLTGAKADAAAFAGILPGGQKQLEHLCSSASLGTADLAEMAARIKRDLEAGARTMESTATREEASADAARRSAGDIDPAAPCDAGPLQAALEAAVRHSTEVSEAHRAGMEAHRRGREALAALATLRAEYSGPTPEEAAESLELAAGKLDAAKRAVLALESQLKDARVAVTLAEREYSAADAAHEAAKSHDQSIAAHERTIGLLSGPTPPQPEEVDAAAAKVTEARQAIERAVLIRQARERLAAAAKHAEAAKEARKQAAELREAARATDDVLSQAVASESLRVVNGRLITTHPTRGDVPYGERSQGTRWRIALDEACSRLRRLGATETALLPVPQQAFECLDPQNRLAIHEHAVRLGVTVVTAEASDGDLRAEPFQHGGNGHDPLP